MFSDVLYNKALKNGTVTQSDVDTIQEFIASLSGKLSGGRTYKLVGILLSSREFFPPYLSCKTRDVQDGINKIRFAVDATGKQRYTQNTQNDRGKIMRRFFLWLCDECRRCKEAVDNNEEHWLINAEEKPKLNRTDIEKITPVSPAKMTKTKSDLLTEEEIIKLIKAARNSRDRALISVPYESGCRSIEIGSLCWNQVKFRKDVVTLNVDGKTGNPRYIPLYFSREYMNQWRNDSQNSDDPDGFVFLALRCKYVDGQKIYKPLTYTGIKKVLVETAQLCGVPKWKCSKIHTFRHSRCTHLIEQEVPETIVKKKFWNNLSTNAFQSYTHLVSSDVDNAIAKLNGISLDDEQKEGESSTKKIMLQQCPVCHQFNAPTAQFCKYCSASLTDEAKTLVEIRRAELDELLEDPTILAVIQNIQRKIKRMKEESE